MRRAAAVGPIALAGLFASAASAGPVDVTVMTRNLYLGANTAAILGAPSLAAIPPAVDAAFDTAIANDFATRARALADEIAASRPHLIGLQEAVIYRTQTPSDQFSGTPTAATTVAVDFLQILNGELAVRGLSY